MRVMLLVCISVTLVGVMACNGRTAQREPMPLPEITSIGQKGVADIVLGIQQITTDPKSGRHLIKALGLYRGDQVGLEVLIRKGMRPLIINDEMEKAGNKVFYRDGAAFRSIGKPSDRFVAALARLYKVKVGAPKMRPTISFTSVSLEGDPRKIETEHVSFKLFHDDQDKLHEYYELYLHVDIRQKRIEIHEKDQEYRANVIKSLSGGS